jgi:hypothetical protein
MTLPPSNPFGGKFSTLTRLPPFRMVGIFEDAVMSPQSIRRASLFVPRLSDVIVCSAPCAGGSLLADVVRRLCKAEPPPERGFCLESKLHDEDADFLTRGAPGGRRRVFETHMTPTMCGPLKHPAMYIYCLRHPLDLSLCFMQHMKACYEIGEQDWPEFDSQYTLDEFCDVPASLCQLNGTQMSYPEYCKLAVEGARENPGSCLIVFYESLVRDPQAQLLRLFEFLSEPADDALLQALDDEVMRQATECGTAAAHCSPATRRMVDVRWADEGLITYEALFESWCAPHPYPYPQEESREEAAAAAPAWQSGRKTILSTASRVTSLAASLAKRGQSSLGAAMAWSPVSGPKKGLKMFTGETLDLTRDGRAESLLTTHALNQPDWMVSSTLNLPPPPQQQQQQQQQREEDSGASSSTSGVGGGESRALGDKFATHHHMEDKVLKHKLEKANMRPSIVKVVTAGKSELSEML